MATVHTVTYIELDNGNKYRIYDRIPYLKCWCFEHGIKEFYDVYIEELTKTRITIYDEEEGCIELLVEQIIGYGEER